MLINVFSYCKCIQKKISLYAKNILYSQTTYSTVLLTWWVRFCMNVCNIIDKPNPTFCWPLDNLMMLRK